MPSAGISLCPSSYGDSLVASCAFPVNKPEDACSEIKKPSGAVLRLLLLLLFL